jgi:drug/metabolite transporter (DMT)-like permease
VPYIYTPHLLALGSALFFGLALVLTQFGLRRLSPLRGATVSVPVTTALFLVLSPFVVDWGGWDLRAVAVFAAVGCLFPASVTLLTFQANRRIGPHLTGALGNLTPLFAVGFAAIMLGELPRPGQSLGIGVIVVGATLLFTTRDGVGERWPRWALLLPLAAALIRGLIQPAVKFGMQSWPDPFAAVLFGYLVSTGVVVAVGALGDRAEPSVGDGRGRLWFAAVGLCNGLAVLILYAALARGPVALVAPLVASYPLATLAFGALLLGRVTLDRRVVLGVVVTVAGVAVLLAASG